MKVSITVWENLLEIIVFRIRELLYTLRTSFRTSKRLFQFRITHSSHNVFHLPNQLVMINPEFYSKLTSVSNEKRVSSPLYSVVSPSFLKWVLFKTKLSSILQNYVLLDSSVIFHTNGKFVLFILKSDNLRKEFKTLIPIWPKYFTQPL